MALKISNSQKGFTTLFIFIITPILLILTLTLIYLFVAQPNMIVGNSMSPTYSNRSYVMSQKISYMLGNPNRGDVVLFENPKSPDVSHIARIIGLPGETVEIKKGQVLINGKILEEPYEPTQNTYSQISKFVVPNDSYFVLGDNRQHSLDSRTNGFIPRSAIVTKILSCISNCTSATISSSTLRTQEQTLTPQNKNKGPISNKVNVASISYFPIQGAKLDQTIVNNSWNEYNQTVEEYKLKVATIENKLIADLEVGSTYHKYQNPSSPAFLDYSIIKSETLNEPVPLSQKNSPNNPSDKITDYTAIINHLGGCDLVDKQNVREIWVWAYTGIGKAGWISNFQSDWGDISDSDQDPNDLPKCGHSYTVYEYNYGRDIPEALQDHIFQQGLIFGFVNHDLFWNRFVGYFPNGNWTKSTATDTTRRCGWANFPPNGQKDFDWQNQTSVQSDCPNWQPDSIGKLETINCQVWDCKTEDFFVYWMQNIPGANNGLTFQNRKLRNWWELISDFDSALLQNHDLME